MEIEVEVEIIKFIHRSKIMVIYKKSNKNVKKLTNWTCTWT